jgi:hypothetical protein
MRGRVHYHTLSQHELREFFLALKLDAYYELLEKPVGSQRVAVS